MKKLLVVLASLFLVLGLSLSIFAQEESSEPAPFSADDNECYAGGTMAGHCENDVDGDGSVSEAEIDWAWNCGWYLARYNDGTFSRGEVPSWCASLLPALSVATNRAMPAPGSGTVCAVLYTTSLVCLTGNYLSVDYTSDGIIDDEQYAFKDTTVGQGAGTVCPVGTIYTGDTTDFITEYYNFVKANGFADTDDWCWRN